MQVEFNPGGGFMRLTVTGSLSYEGFVEAFNALVAHESFHPGVNAIWDMRGATLAVVPTETLRRIARLARDRQQERRGARIAAVVGSDADFGVARIYEGVAADLPMEFRVFRDLAEAERWAAGPQPT